MDDPQTLHHRANQVIVKIFFGYRPSRDYILADK